MSPLIPTALDSAMVILSLIAVILAIIALVFIAKDRRDFQSRILAALFVCVVPLVGPVFYFIVRRGERRGGGGS